MSNILSWIGAVSDLGCQYIWSCLLTCSIGVLLQQAACRHMLAQQQPALLSTVAPSCSNQTAVWCCCRQTGRAVFRQTLLAKHGKLILIPLRELIRSSVPDLAAYLQQELEAVAGGSIVPYRG